MDNYINFRKQEIADRQIDTFIGLCKGLTADGKINKCEAYVLMGWLIQGQAYARHPFIIRLFEQVSNLLNKGEPSKESLNELYLVLKKFSGDDSELGELAKPTGLPITSPEPPVVFKNNVFVFTGKFAFGTRQQCADAVERKAGKVANNVTQATTYMVIGSYVSESWKHETFGRKIEKALSLPDLKIITEHHFIKALGD
jgi:NAD-dependent DNA ligase